MMTRDLIEVGKERQGSEDYGSRERESQNGNPRSEILLFQIVPLLWAHDCNYMVVNIARVTIIFR